MNNTLGLKMRLIDGKATIELSHIPFENTAFIWTTSKSDLKRFLGEEGLIVPSELERSSYGSGKYLIFTDVSGIADDAGWDYVNVEHTNGLVTWEFWFNDDLINLSFDSNEYRSEIAVILDQLKALPKDITVEPSQVVFPEQ